MPLALRFLTLERPRRGLAGSWLCLDVAGAVMFAAGLALALSGLAQHTALAPGLALLLAGGLWRAAMSALGANAGARTATRAKAAIRARVTPAVLWTVPSSAAAKGERIGAIVEDVEALDGWFSRYLPAAQAARIAPLLALAAVFAASPMSGFILMGAFIPFIALMALIGMTTASAARAQFGALARLSGLFVDRVRALPLIFAYGGGAQQTEIIAGAAREVKNRTLAVLRVAFMSSATLEFFAALSVALVAVYIGFKLLGLLPFHAPEQLDLLRGVFVLALAPEIYAPLRRLAGAYHDKQAGEAAGERIAATLQNPSIARPAPLAADQAPALRVVNARVRYGEGAEIGPFSFTAPAGAITALLGPSGTGKTSLLTALLGLTPLAAGEAYAGDAALSDAGSFASIAAYAGQRPLVLARSIADNIRIGAPEASDAAVRAAADAVGLGAMLKRRDSAVMLDERGSGLSGGERRRIGIARALLKRAPMLLLDEPTADLDGVGEDEIIALLMRERGHRTIIVATHSPRLAAAADHVVRL